MTSASSHTPRPPALCPPPRTATVCPLLARELDRRHDVGHVGAAGDRGRPAVDHRVVDGAGRVVARRRRAGSPARASRPEACRTSACAVVVMAYPSPSGRPPDRPGIARSVGSAAFGDRSRSVPPAPRSARSLAARPASTRLPCCPARWTALAQQVRPGRAGAPLGVQPVQLGQPPPVLMHGRRGARGIQHHARGLALPGPDQGLRQQPQIVRLAGQRPLVPQPGQARPGSARRRPRRRRTSR